MKREPPIEYRFKKGQSGNPKGRPKKVDKQREFLNLATKVLHLAYKALNSDERAILILEKIRKIIDKINY